MPYADGQIVPYVTEKGYSSFPTYTFLPTVAAWKSLLNPGVVWATDRQFHPLINIGRNFFPNINLETSPSILSFLKGFSYCIWMIYIKSALHRPVFISLFSNSAFWSVLCGLIIPMQPEFILKLDGSIWQIIRQTRLLGAVSGDRKKVLTLGLTDRGKLDKVIKSSERDAAHQAQH